MHGEDLDGKDGEEHGHSEDQGYAKGEPVELLEEIEKRDDFSGGALGFFDAGHGGG